MLGMTKKCFALIGRLYGTIINRTIKTGFVLLVSMVMSTGLMQGGAHAQTSNSLPLAPSVKGTGTVLTRVSVDQLAALLTASKFTVLVNQASDGRKFLRVQTTGGANFFVDLLQCEDRLAATGCGGVLLRAGMSNSGVTYDDLNNFNRSSSVASGFNLPELNLIGFTRLAIVSGGIQAENLQLQIALFLLDMDMYVTNRNAATSVSFEGANETNREQMQKNKSASRKVIALDTIDHNESDLDDLPGWAAGLRDSSMIESAIYNTYSVEFMNETMRALLGQ